MEADLPSYGEAVARDSWQFIPRYLSPDSLCALCRVSHDFHKKISPWLWGNPAEHFIRENVSHDPRRRERIYGMGNISDQRKD